MPSATPGKKEFFGGKKTFFADSFSLGRKTKKVAMLEDGKIKLVDAQGYHGRVYALEVKKGKHRVKLVTKMNSGKFCEQNLISEREYRVFQQLRKKGYPVPPTTRMVQIWGEWFVAITDLSKFGDVQTNSGKELNRIVGKQKAEQAINLANALVEKARKEEGLDLSNSIEYVIDSKKATVKVFVLDLGHVSHGRDNPLDYIE